MIIRRPTALQHSKLLSSPAEGSPGRGACQGAGPASAPFTVAAAMDAYFERLELEGSNSLPMLAAGRGFISFRRLETCRLRT